MYLLKYGVFNKTDFYQLIVICNMDFQLKQYKLDIFIVIANILATPI